MRTLIVVLIALLMQACGHEGPDVDSALRPLLDRYLSLAPNNGKLEALEYMRFGTPPQGKDGLCMQSDRYLGPRRVMLHRTLIVAPGQSGATYEALVMHELAHCLHDKQHSADPENIMHYKIRTDDAYWNTHLDEQVRALFDNPIDSML